MTTSPLPAEKEETRTRASASSGGGGAGGGGGDEDLPSTDSSRRSPPIDRGFFFMLRSIGSLPSPSATPQQAPAASASSPSHAADGAVVRQSLAETSSPPSRTSKEEEAETMDWVRIWSTPSTVMSMAGTGPTQTAAAASAWSRRRICALPVCARWGVRQDPGYASPEE